MAADAEDATNENIPLPKNLTLPGVKTLPRDYCKTPFELKDNVLCKAAGRCMKSVTYGNSIQIYLYILFYYISFTSFRIFRFQYRNISQINFKLVISKLLNSNLIFVNLT